MATANGGKNGGCIGGGLSPDSSGQPMSDRRSIEDLLAGEDLSYMDDSSSDSSVRDGDNLLDDDAVDAADVADAAWHYQQYQRHQQQQLQFPEVVGQHIKPDSSLLLERLLSDQSSPVNGGSGGNLSPVIQRKGINLNCEVAGQVPDADEDRDDVDDGLAVDAADDDRLRVNDAAPSLDAGLRSPPDGGSDTESLPESIYHQPPKAADREAAARLARRLYLLEGFKFTDVAKHLSRKNDFNTIVGEEYANNFDFSDDTLDAALRKFLSRFCLLGDTADQERVLLHFAKSYLRCNPGSYPSADSCHTLACALLLLNKDLHGMAGQRMTSQQFIDNLANLNEGDNYPREVLKSLYQAIRAQPILQPASVPILSPQAQQQQQQHLLMQTGIGSNGGGGICVLRPTPQHPSGGINGPAMDSSGSPTILPPHEQQLLHQQQQQQSGPGIEFRRGYLARKQVLDAGGRRTRKGRRAWRRIYCVLTDLRLAVYKDESAAEASAATAAGSATPPAPADELRVHHALASPAEDYAKRRHVWRLRLANGAELLLQSQSPDDLADWVAAVNRSAALLSSPALPPPVGSQPASAYARPLLPSVPSHFGPVEQLERHLEQVLQIERELQFLSDSGFNNNIAASAAANASTGLADNNNGAPVSNDGSPAVSMATTNPSPAILRRQNSTGSSGSGAAPASSSSSNSSLEHQRHVAFLQSEVVRYKTYARLLELMAAASADLHQQYQQHHQLQQLQLQQYQLQQLQLQQNQMHQLLPLKSPQSPLFEDAVTTPTSAATSELLVESPTFGNSGAFRPPPPPTPSTATTTGPISGDLYEIV